MHVTQAPSQMTDDVFEIPSVTLGIVMQIYTDRDRFVAGRKIPEGSQMSFDGIVFDDDTEEFLAALSVAMVQDRVGPMILCKMVVGEGETPRLFAMRRFKSRDLAYSRWSALLEDSLYSFNELLMQVSSFRLPGTPDFRASALGEPQTPYGQQWQDGQGEAGPDLYWGGRYAPMRNPC